MRFAYFSLISFIALTLLFVPNKANAGSLNWTAYSTSHYAPYVESSCYNNYSYLSTCNNTNWAYVNSTPIASGTMTSINHNWNSGSIIPDGSTNIGSQQRMLVITGYWQHPGTTGQTSTVYFAGRNDDGLIVNINNTAVISDWAQQGPTYWNSYGSFSGVGGQWYPIVINWYEWGGSANMDIHYRIDGSSGVGTTSGWLDHTSSMFSSTEPGVSITTNQASIKTTAQGVTSSENKVNLTTDGDYNDINIQQAGNNNFIIGTNWTSNATVTGNNNTVTINQGNVTSNGNSSVDNGLGLDITGNSNTLIFSQGDAGGDTGGHRSWLDIDGNTNHLNITQKDNGTSGTDGDHFLYLDLDASSNTITLMQSNDNDKTMFLDINNDSNTIDITQKGAGSHFLDITTAGSAHDIDIMQKDDGNHAARVDLGGYSYNFDLTQQGSSSQSYSVTSSCGAANGCTLNTTQGQ